MTQKLKIIIILILIIILLNNLQIKYEKFIFTNNKNTKLPTLTFKSYPNCPILRNLYFGLSQLEEGSEDKYKQNENEDGMKFRSLIQSTFYNVDEHVEVDLPLINLLVEKKTSDTDSLPNFIFNYETDTNIKYIDDNYLEFDKKEAVFGVKENFEMEDIMRYLNYCFYECGNEDIVIKNISGSNIENPDADDDNKFKKMVHMKYMTLTGSHLWALRCHACKNNDDQHFYILPERIRYMAEKQGKKYTRAKCTNCHRNIIVYFYDDAIPDFSDEYNLSSNNPNLSNINLID